VEAFETLREQVTNQLQKRIKPQEMSGNPDQTERHKQESKPESIIELERCSWNERSDSQSQLNRLTRQKGPFRWEWY
jgi:replication initiation protein RepC